MATCYMCDQLATSFEHVPPRCIFPTAADAGGVDYRRNLITVPSCDLHNSARSKDDEYLLMVLASSITSSEVGLQQFLSKVQRALERRPKLGMSLEVSDIPQMRPSHRTGDLVEAYEIVPDGERLDRVFDACARALYFHHTKTPYIGVSKAVAPFMSYKNSPGADDALRLMMIQSERLMESYPVLGENPEVFRYKFAYGGDSAMFFLTFYGGSQVVVRLVPAQ